MKTCCSCKLVLPLSEFNRNRSTEDGVQKQCRACSKESNRAHLAKKHAASRAAATARKAGRADLAARGLKTCYSCQWELPFDAFSVNKATVDQLNWQCRDCGAAKAYVSQIAKHGITEADYEAMLEGQGGVCAICGDPPAHLNPRTRTVRRLAVDHDHSCCPGNSGCANCVRGLLCDTCNRGIGQLGDDPERVYAAYVYLQSRALPPAAA